MTKRLIVSRHPATVAYLREILGPEWANAHCPACDDRLEGRLLTEIRELYPDYDAGLVDQAHDWSAPGAHVHVYTHSEDVEGAVVAGNLPLHLAALASEVIAVEFAENPPRGRDYGRVEMEAAGVHLRRYRVEALL